MNVQTAWDCLSLSCCPARLVQHSNSDGCSNGGMGACTKLIDTSFAGISTAGSDGVTARASSVQSMQAVSSPAVWFDLLMSRAGISKRARALFKQKALACERAWSPWITVPGIPDSDNIF